MIWTTPRTARKATRCPSCDGRINQGDRYLEHVAAPHHDELNNERWWRLPECGTCAERYGRPIPPAAPTSPPYWPYRCAACARFVSNPQVQLGPDPNPWAVVRIVAETGDCKKCGPQVPLCRLGWDDWFGENDPLDEIVFGDKAAAA